jgi:dTDP-4-amino-4,6-dideoxygalactose transaminase
MQNPNRFPVDVAGVTGSLANLALFGGTPRFDRDLFVGTPNIGDREQLMARLNDILDRRWLTNNGSYVQQFEDRIIQLTGVKHCITVCNATIGLELAIRALGLTGEVIVPSYTFIASAHALQWLGIRPVFCDIDPATHNLDPACIEALITPSTTGIMAVNLWGRGCVPREIERIAERHGLSVIFDSAHAFGCSAAGRMIGNFGNAEVFSFHATKFVNSLEGGAIVCNDDALAARIRTMVNFGFTGLDQVAYLGTNAKMNEFSAAMGITSLDAMPHFLAVNRGHYRLYQQGLAAIPGIRLIDYDDGEISNYHYIVLEIDEARLGLSRDDLVGALWAERVKARRYFHPGCHLMEPYRTLDPDADRRLPATNRVAAQVMLLPNGTAISTEEVREICALIEQFSRDPMAVRIALRKSSSTAEGIGTKS